MKRSKSALNIYLKEVNQYPLLSKEEEYKLAVAAREGDEAAREKLIKSNLRFVLSVARHFNMGVAPFMDLVSAGNEGLVRAAQDFEPERGNRFLSYAVHWIRAKIERALWEQRLIKLPYHVLRKSVRYTGLKKDHPEWTEEELAKAADVSLEEARILQSANIPFASLNARLFSGNEVKMLQDALMDAQAPSGERQITVTALHDTLKMAMQEPLVQKATVEVDKPHALRYADSVSISASVSRKK